MRGHARNHAKQVLHRAEFAHLLKLVEEIVKAEGTVGDLDGGLAGLLALLAGLLAQRAPALGVAVRVELHGLVAQLELVGGLEWRHDLAHELLGGVELVCVVLGHEGERPAGLARAARAPDAVDIVLGVHGHVEVHDVAHVGDVDAAGEDVGGNEDVTATVAEGAQGALALVLAAVAVDGGAGDVGAAQAAAAGVRAVLRAAEDDDALGALLLEHLGEQRVLGLERDGQRKLVDGLGNRALVRDLHDGRIAHEVADAADGVLVERGREQQRLARGGRLAHDLAHGGQKAHVEHAVCLVEHEHLDVIEVGLALLDEVNDGAGGVLDRLHLLRKVLAEGVSAEGDDDALAHGAISPLAPASPVAALLLQ